MLKRKKLSLVILLVILLLGFVFFRVAQSKYVAPIAMYHSVVEHANPDNRLEVSKYNLERQMRFLKKNKYNVIPLESLAKLIKEGRKIPPKTICITFDDGYKNNYINAFPILKKYNLPATMFIIVNEVGRPQQDRLSWEEIKEMQASGIITIGSHCLGPEPLTNIQSHQQIKKEIFDSKRLLEEMLKKRVNLFSYPEGRFNDEIRDLVIKAGYLGAVVTSPGKKFRNDDEFALKRLRISSTSNNLFVFWIEISGFYTFIKEHRDDD